MASNTMRRSSIWADIPSEILRAELVRRQEDPPQPACGSGEKGTYNTPLHVFALILILVLSTVACGFPLISRRASKNDAAKRVVFLSQHFGTGVLIATAFVHLLPTAFVSLTDPCLPHFFSQGYRPLAGFVAMFSALVVVGLEMFLTTRGAGHSHGAAWEPLPDEEINGDAHPINGSSSHSLNGKAGKTGATSRRSEDIALKDVESEGLMNGVSPLPVSTPIGGSSNDNTKYADREEDEDDDNDNLSELDDIDMPLDSLSYNHPNADIESHHHVAKSGLSQEEQRKKMVLQCLLLEAGILFHSVFIGMAVSVATGPPFIVFLVAIAFHQTFEGLALGSRIAAISFPKGSFRPWLMVLAYGTTTPIGQVIGLIVHNLYDPHSATGLLMVGFMNAISSGLLLFAGLVQLLAEDFLSDKSYGILKGRSRIEAFSAVISGSLLMSLVGAWA
ncbi:Zinc/iron permease [Xylogone sp. PMI_703]|nr:Zinc/iron permease [Xylogone sp. PMI_703]